MGERVTGRSRRHVLNTIGWGLALPALALPASLSAKAGPVTFPTGRIRLRRTLERGLGDGKAVIVTREWDCRFVRLSTGAKIDGQQVAVSVETPPALTALADIERKREVAGLFPMELDRSGAIVGWSDENASIAQAVAQASREIDRKAMQQAAEADVKRYLAELGKTAASLVSQVPRDLFFPAPGKRSESRKLALPGGGTGTYEVTISASARTSDGLLAQSERRIVTRIADSTRVSRETWSVA